MKMEIDYGLDDRQKKFADLYLLYGNAKRSALEAGYSESTAHQASKLLKNPSIRSYIGQKTTEFEGDKIADQQEVLEFLTTVMRGEMTEEKLYNIGNYKQDIIDLQVGVNDRSKAGELLGKRYALFKDQLDAQITVPTIIQGEDELED